MTGRRPRARARWPTTTRRGARRTRRAARRSRSRRRIGAVHALALRHVRPVEPALALLEAGDAGRSRRAAHALEEAARSSSQCSETRRFAPCRPTAGGEPPSPRARAGAGADVGLTLRRGPQPQRDGSGRRLAAGGVGGGDRRRGGDGLLDHRLLGRPARSRGAGWSAGAGCGSGAGRLGRRRRLLGRGAAPAGPGPLRRARAARGAGGSAAGGGSATGGSSAGTLATAIGLACEGSGPHPGRRDGRGPRPRRRPPACARSARTGHRAGGAGRRANCVVHVAEPSPSLSSSPSAMPLLSESPVPGVGGDDLLRGVRLPVGVVVVPSPGTPSRLLSAAPGSVPHVVCRRSPSASLSSLRVRVRVRHCRARCRPSPRRGCAGRPGRSRCIDSDLDGLRDLVEAMAGTGWASPDTNADGVPTAPTTGTATASPQDGQLAGTDPGAKDSNRDGVPDNEDDNDADGLSNATEQVIASNPGTGTPTATASQTATTTATATASADVVELVARQDPASAALHPADPGTTPPAESDQDDGNAPDDPAPPADDRSEPTGRAPEDDDGAAAAESVAPSPDPDPEP